MRVKNFTGSDAAIKKNDCDKYGYSFIAKGLAQSIIDVDDVDGVVIGIEGSWGSGKSSLLNLLSNEIKKTNREDIHVIKIAPWATGDRSSIVSSLLVPVANIICEIELKRMSPNELKKRNKKEKLGEYKAFLSKYISKTSGFSSAVLDSIGGVVPGASIASDLLDAAGKLDFSKHEKTVEEEKEEIGIKISELGIRFIIMIDDLDRLEPGQAVEVVRLVKSVANFPHFTYLMCYDRDVLSHAIQQGLKVSDGNKYLQKIVQLSFPIPLPEFFDLRNELRESLSKYYYDYNGIALDSDSKSELSRIIDVFGGGLSTPREVKNILNSFCFIYQNVFDKIYFPDLCFTLIIKCVNPELYRWMENYLRIRSVITTRHASVGKSERNAIGNKLMDILAEEGDYSSSKSIFSLHGIIPGLNSRLKGGDIVFNQVSDIDENKNRRYRRLGSSAHYRYYFAFSAPKNVFSELSFKELFDFSEKEPDSFNTEMINLIVAPGFAGMTWFEYIIDQINDIFAKELSNNQIRNILSFFFGFSDNAFLSFMNRREFFSISDLNVNDAVNDLFKELMRRDDSSSLNDFIIVGNAINWIVGSYFRDRMWDHGIVGNRPVSNAELVFKESDVDESREFLRNKLADFTFIEFSKLPSKGSFLYGWAEISSYDYVKKWVKENTRDNTALIMVLNALRSKTVSTKVSYPLHEKNVENFFNLENVKKRLANIETDDAKDILSAMEEARRFW